MDVDDFEESQYVFFLYFLWPCVGWAHSAQMCILIVVGCPVPLPFSSCRSSILLATVEERMPVAGKRQEALLGARPSADWTCGGLEFFWNGVDWCRYQRSGGACKKCVSLFLIFLVPAKDGLTSYCT